MQQVLTAHKRREFHLPSRLTVFDTVTSTVTSDARCHRLVVNPLAEARWLSVADFEEDERNSSGLDGSTSQSSRYFDDGKC